MPGRNAPNQGHFVKKIAAKPSLEGQVAGLEVVRANGEKVDLPFPVARARSTSPGRRAKCARDLPDCG